MTERFSPLLGRKRQRRGVDSNRRFADEIEKSRAVQAFGPRAAHRRPTRVLPDISGFEILPKTDAKKDIKDMRKHSSLSVFLYDSGSDDNEDDEDEDETGVIVRSIRAPISAESTLVNKKKRYASWVYNPTSMQSDLLAYSRTVALVKKELQKLETEEENWIDTFETSRKHMIATLSSLQEEIHDKRADARGLFELGAEQCGISQKRRALNVTDLINELDDRQSSLDEQMVEFEKFVADSALQAKTDGNATLLAALPVVSFTVDLADVPDDGFRRPSSHVTSPEILDESSTAETKEQTEGDGPAPLDFPTCTTGSLEATESGDRASRDTSPHQPRSAPQSSPVARVHSPMAGRLKPRTKPRSTADTEPVDGSPTLFSLFSLAEKSLHWSEAALSDLDPFLPEVPDSDTHSATRRGVEEVGIGERNTEQFVNLLLNTMDDRQWLRTLHEKAAMPTSAAAMISRKQRRKGASHANSSVINLRTFALPQTPRGVPLLVSPLSTLPDRVLGAVYGKEDSEPTRHEQKLLSRRSFIPSQLIACELVQTAQWDVQSHALRLGNRLRKLSQSADEWERRVIEAAAVLQKTESASSALLYEDAVDVKRCRRELLQHGLVASNDADAPLSPIAVNNAMSFPSGANRVNRNKRPGKALVQKFTPSVHSSPVMPPVSDKGLSSAISSAPQSDESSVAASSGHRVSSHGEANSSLAPRSPSLPEQESVDGTDGMGDSSKAASNKRNRPAQNKRKPARRY